MRIVNLRDKIQCYHCDMFKSDKLRITKLPLIIRKFITVLYHFSTKMDSFYLLLFLAALLTLLYFYLNWSFNYWKRQGVESVSSIVTNVCNDLSVLFIRQNASTLCNKIYQKCSQNASMIGIYFMQKPMLIIRDPELVKTVLVKDFQSFRNNIMTLSEKHDPFMVKNPFFAVDELWKESRAQLVNSMSQKKLKILFGIMHRVSLKFENYLDKIVNKGSATELELKDVLSKFTGEVVANTAFGIEGQSFETNRSPASFIATVERLFEPTLVSSIRQVLTFYLSDIAKTLRVSFLSREISDFFFNTVESVIAHRKKEGSVNDDFLQMSMEGLNDIDSKICAGRISAFFFDAYETAANIAAFACFRLSHNPCVQENARRHIKEVLDKYDGVLGYEALKDMTYLDQIIYETARLHPIIGVILRICNRKITLEASNGQTCHLEPGNLVCIPVQSLHTDDKYWKDPHVFDPDRFSEERKSEITKFTFLPFSEGPRICAGMRYGIMAVKTALVTILSKYNIESSTKTEIPVILEQGALLTGAKYGLWAKLEKIKKNE